MLMIIANQYTIERYVENHTFKRITNQLINDYKGQALTIRR